MSSTRTEDLDAVDRKLLRLFQRIDYGHVELKVIGGRPVLDPMPRAVREIRLKPGRPRKPAPTDFALKAQMIELFRQLQQVPDGATCRVDLQGGIPFRIVIEGF